MVTNASHMKFFLFGVCRGDRSLLYQEDMQWIDVEYAGSNGVLNLNSELGRAMNRRADYSNFLVEAALTLDNKRIQTKKEDETDNLFVHVNSDEEYGGDYDSNLMECISSNNTKPGCLPLVTVIHREEGSGRHIVNERDIINQAKQMCGEEENANNGIKSNDMRPPQCKVIRVDLSHMSLGEQVLILQSTSVLIGAIGTGLHNSVFMRGSEKMNKAIIMFAPLDWSGHVSQFGNEAILNGIHVMIACQQRNNGDETHNKQWHTMAWGAREWRQGPWRTKDSPVEVDLNSFKELFSKAMNLSLSPSPSSSIFHYSRRVPSHHIIVTEVPDHMITYQLLLPPPLPINGDDVDEIGSNTNSTAHQPIPIPLFNNPRLHYDSGRAIACLSFPYWGVATPVQRVIGKGGEVVLQLSLQAYVLLDSIPRAESLVNIEFCLEVGGGSDVVVSCWHHNELSQRSPLIIAISRPEKVFSFHTWLRVHNGYGREKQKWPASDNYYVWNGLNLDSLTQNEKRKDEASLIGGCFRPLLGLPARSIHYMQQQYDVLGSNGGSCLCDLESMAHGTVRPHHQPVIKFGILIEEAESSVDGYDDLGSLWECEEYSKNFPCFTNEMTVSPPNNSSAVENRSACLKKERPPRLPRYIMANACCPESIEIAKNEACLSVMSTATSQELGMTACKAVSLELMSRSAVELAAHEMGLPPQQLWPTPQRPFLFFHLEKCGGSSVRSILASSASRRKVHALIPCYTSHLAEEEEESADTSTTSPFSYTYNPTEKECLQFDLHQLSPSAQKKISVLAMHHVNGFNAWQDLPSVCKKQQAGDGAAADVTTMPFDCFVMLRHPIERTISLFSSRIRVTSTKIGVELSLNSLSAADLTEIIRLESVGIHNRKPNHHDSDLDSSAYGDIFVDAGMSDAACKMLCGATRLHGHSVLDPMPSTLPYDLSTAKAHLSKYVRWIEEGKDRIFFE